MGLPGHRRTSSHKRRRAAHFALKKTMLAVCPKCKEPILPHTACASCGTYAGRKVLTLRNPLEKGTKAKTAKAGSAAAGKQDHEGHNHDHDKDAKTAGK